MSVTSDRRQGVNSGAAIKVPCSAVATTPITLAGEQTINGIAVHAANPVLRTVADRVLVTAQVNAAANGIYDVSTAAWRRALDFNGEFDVKNGTAVPVFAAGDYSIWILSAIEPIVPDTTLLIFSKQTDIPPLDTLATILPWTELEQEPQKTYDRVPFIARNLPPDRTWIGLCNGVSTDVVLPANTFSRTGSEGDIFTTYNGSSNTLNLTAGSTAMVIHLGGTTTTGSRSLLPFGLGTIWFPSSNVVITKGDIS